MFLAKELSITVDTYPSLQTRLILTWQLGVLRIIMFFKPDNALCHVVEICRAWLEEHAEEFQLLFWPPNSTGHISFETLREHLNRYFLQQDCTSRNILRSPDTDIY
ncbi:hypothetical protein NPIL_345171 [Nephila pilipes]|uniref:Uncharacterized protein n=1 Tax=Nephila pilipes TaxID=299642 RepID=A0A8X6NFZ9_NEPPI|nr:hypothetical protein NPIL_345171 [Nephila pilipes]